MAPPSPADILMTCPACHQPLTPGVKFCESCGAKVAPAPLCPHCGDKLTPGVKFCESCGRPVGSEPAPAAPPVPDPAGPGGAPAVPVIPEKPAAKKGTRKAKEGGKKTAKRLPLKEQGTGEPAPAPAADLPGEVPAQPLPDHPVAPLPELPAAASRPAEEPAPPAPEARVLDVSEKEPENAIPGPVLQAPPAPAPRTWMLAAGGIAGLLVVAAVVWLVVLPMLSAPSAGGNGFTLPGTSPSPTAVPAASATQTAPVVSFEPLPTQRLPVSLEVVYQAERDPRNGIVTVTFRGGPGMNGIAETLVRVTKSDGQVVTKTFKPRQIGDSVSVQGTMQRDRVEVISNFYNGESYRCIDTVFEYKQRN